MDKAVKIKIIIFASMGVLVLAVVALFISSGSKPATSENDNVNTSLRAQQQSDFTLNDMMKSEGEQAHPDYENFSNAEPLANTNKESAEEKTLQASIEQNEQPEATRPTRSKKTVKKKEPEAAPVPEKRNRFFSGEKTTATGNTIEVIVSGDQQITDGSVIKLITLQNIPIAGNIEVKKGTALFGVVELRQDRINVTIQSVRMNNSIYDLKKTVYDRDGLPGIYIPLNIKAEAAKEATTAAVSDVNVSTTGGDMLSTGVNAVTSAAKSVFTKKNNQIVVTVKSNYKLYLK